MIGDDGLKATVLAEIDLALKAHELIKIRVMGDDRAARLTLLEAICTTLNAAPIQQIGKLLIVYRPKPREKAEPERKERSRRAPRPGSKLAAKRAARSPDAPKRNPISGRIMAERAPRKATKAATSASPPRTERVRKAGQKSSKKPFQTQ
jgi:RNA-binding protein YhbY